MDNKNIKNKHIPVTATSIQSNSTKDTTTFLDRNLYKSQQQRDYNIIVVGTQFCDDIPRPKQIIKETLEIIKKYKHYVTLNDIFHEPSITIRIQNIPPTPKEPTRTSQTNNNAL